MKLAEEMFGEDVDKIDMQAPTWGVLVAGSMVDDDGTVHILDTVALIKTALVRQPTHTERWRPLMRFLKEQGVVRMIELNETPSLTSWNRRMFGGEREQINLPGVTGADGKDIAVAWTWDAPVEVEVAPVEVQIEGKQLEVDSEEMAEMNEEVEELLKVYASLKATEELTVAEQFIQLPAPETFGGMLLWYRQWMAFRQFKKLEEVKPETDYTKDLKGDSLDYEVLRADVEAVFGYPVDPEEAKNRTYPRIMAQATWDARKELLGST